MGSDMVTSTRELSEKPYKVGAAARTKRAPDLCKLDLLLPRDVVLDFADLISTCLHVPWIVEIENAEPASPHPKRRGRNP